MQVAEVQDKARELLQLVQSGQVSACWPACHAGQQHLIQALQQQQLSSRVAHARARQHLCSC